MPVNDALGQRMKDYYESIPKTRLMRRCPVAVRIDGKVFHSFTRGFQKPFDEVLITSMQETMKYLCENIQGCILGYSQSDEITLILLDYQTFTTDAFFNYEVQKMCSIIASMATMAFNRFFTQNVDNFRFAIGYDENGNLQTEKYKQYSIYSQAVSKGAMFDCRVFNIPKEEVTNLIYWRQLDATRNSIQMVGQANFPHSELQNKSCNDIQNMLLTQKDINWNDFPTHQKRGSCCIKITEQDPNIDIKDGYFPRSKWVIDKEIPIFKGEDRDYIEKLIMIGEE
jgi:tRNA(His) 5'-end guanylyltransferase